MHTIWVAQVTVGRFYAYAQHATKQEAQAWLAHQMERAHRKGLQIRSPKIIHMTVSDYRDDVRRDWADD